MVPHLTSKVNDSQTWGLEAKVKEFQFPSKKFFLTIKKKKLMSLLALSHHLLATEESTSVINLAGHTVRLRKQPDPRQRDESMKQTGWGSNKLVVGRQREVLVLASPAMRGPSSPHPRRLREGFTAIRITRTPAPGFTSELIHLRSTRGQDRESARTDTSSFSGFVFYTLGNII